MIKLKDVSKFYNANGITTPALEHINLEFKRGDIVAITGESGSGKSTLLNVICGNDFYDDGEIYFYEDETSYFDISDADNFRNKYVGFIYQNYNIIESYTVLENVMFPLLLKGMKKKEAKAKATELIYKVGLKDRIKHKGTKLSGGEKQRVVIARALAKDADILACDEPTGNLDSKTAKEIIDLIYEVAKDKLVLIVTHNYEQVKDIATRKVTLVDGHVIEDKVLKEVSDDKKEEMILEKPKMTFLNYLYLIKNNIFSTPKKTMFIFLMLFVTCFTLISIFQSINYIYNTNQAKNVDRVSNYDPNYIIVNKDDHKALNKEDFNDYASNKISWHNYVLDYSFNHTVYKTYKITNILPSYFNLIGVLPLLGEGQSTQGLLILPSNDSAYNYKENLGNNVYVSNVPINIKIMGICNSLYVSTPVIYIPYNEAYIALKNELLMNQIEANLSNFPAKTMRIGIGQFISKPLLFVPYAMRDFGTLDITVADIYKLSLDYDIKYSEENRIELLIPAEYIEETFPVFEVGLIVDNVSEATKKYEDLGYNVYYPYEHKTLDVSIVLTIIVLTILTVVPAILLYFITYIVVKTIYSTKFKDFMIMRSIGLDRKSMRIILGLETFLLSFLSSGITFSISIIIAYLFNITLYKNTNAYVLSLFFVIMFVFSLLLAIKMNKRLFKQTTALGFREV